MSRLESVSESFKNKIITNFMVINFHNKDLSEGKFKLHTNILQDTLFLNSLNKEFNFYHNNFDCIVRII